jgi:hypothetical protein
MAEPENSSTISQPQSPTEPAEHADASALSNRGPESSTVAKPLTPEEQMALYEKELKENDWGHQPC